MGYQARAGARRRGRWAGRWASGLAAGAGRAWASGLAAGAGRAWARGQALQAVGPAGARRNGRAELAGARQAESAVGGARGRLGERQQAREACSRLRQGRAGRPAERPVRTWVCSIGPGWGFVHPDSVFGPV